MTVWFPIFVASDIMTGIFGVVGVLVGGGVTFAVNYLNVLTQRDQARRARDHQVSDVRRDACISFLTRGERFLDSTREVSAALDSSITGSQLTKIHQRYASEWATFVASSAALQIAGPPDLARTADAFRKKVGALSEIVDNQYLGKRWPGGYDDAYTRAFTDIQQSRTTFVNVAQRLFAPSLGERAVIFDSQGNEQQPKPSRSQFDSQTSPKD